LTAIVIGPTPEEFHPSSYFDINLVLLLLQLQHFLNEHSLPHFQKCIPILGRLHFCWRLLLISQTSLKNQSIRWVLLFEISRTCQAKLIYAWPSQYFWFNKDVKKAIWWSEDFKETLGKVYRQANNNSSSDFKDSELLLQDFINRYVDPSSTSPLKNLARLAWYRLNRFNNSIHMLLESIEFTVYKENVQIIILLSLLSTELTSIL